MHDDAVAPPHGEDPDEIVDAVFAIACRTLPVDHAWALSRAIQAILPWFAQAPEMGLHPVHGAASGAGWMRPEGSDAVLQVSRRARLVLRLPRRRLDAAGALLGCTLQVDGHPLRVEKLSVRPLSRITTLFARNVALEGGDDEAGFLVAAERGLDSLAIKPHTLLCGRATVVVAAGERVLTRSLMLAGLTPSQALVLQQHGLGRGRAFGCGLFIPHKAIGDLRARPD